MKRRAYLFLAVAALLALPAVGMLVSDEVNWSPFDFVIAFVLLGGAAWLIDIIWHRVRSLSARVFPVALVLLVLLFIWAELAVGLVGSPWAGS
jgi:hypothetical protein